MRRTFGSGKNNKDKKKAKESKESKESSSSSQTWEQYMEGNTPSRSFFCFLAWLSHGSGMRICFLGRQPPLFY